MLRGKAASFLYFYPHERERERLLVINTLSSRTSLRHSSNVSENIGDAASAVKVAQRKWIRTVRARADRLNAAPLLSATGRPGSFDLLSRSRAEDASGKLGEGFISLNSFAGVFPPAQFYYCSVGARLHFTSNKGARPSAAKQRKLSGDCADNSRNKVQQFIRAAQFFRSISMQSTFPSVSNFQILETMGELFIIGIHFWFFDTPT